MYFNFFCSPTSFSASLLWYLTWVDCRITFRGDRNERNADRQSILFRFRFLSSSLFRYHFLSISSYLSSSHIPSLRSLLSAPCEYVLLCLSPFLLFLAHLFVEVYSGACFSQKQCWRVEAATEWLHTRWPRMRPNPREDKQKCSTIYKQEGREHPGDIQAKWLGLTISSKKIYIYIDSTLTFCL